MPQRVRIRCINKRERQNPGEHITHVGGLNADQTRWKLTEEEAIIGIEAKKWTFFVERPAGHEVDVIIAVSPRGRKYLKTVADDETPNNLLSLPECP